MADHATAHRDAAPPGVQRLLAAQTAQEVALALVQCIRAHPGAKAVSVLRQGEGGIERLAGDEGADDAAWACAAPAPRRSGDGTRLVLPLAPATVVLLTIDPGDQGLSDAIALPLQVAGALLARSFRLDELSEANAGLVHSEQVQRALFAIADLAGSERDMADMLREIHAIVATLMYAENFFIVLHDSQRESIRFLYFADVEDTAPRDPQREIPLATREHTLTWYLVRDGKPLMGNTEALRRQVPGPLKVFGPDGNDWLGVPMLREGQVRGALVVQSYQAGIGYGPEDMALLSFVGSHILTALERKQGKVELERSVQLRTQELADANQDLQRQILERQRAERLQAALFQLAQLATADISQEAFYRRVHEVVGQLLNAENFFIALLTEDRGALEFPYYVDARGRSGLTRPLGRGLSEYVMRQGDVFMGTSEDISALAERGEIELQVAGQPALSWLGAPLLVGSETIGLVAVQSYTPTVRYGPADRELLAFVASQIANSLNRRRAAVMQQRSMVLLEQRVEERTHELRKEIHERERIQEQLKHQVMHDALTGLPNRGYLLDRLERVLSQFRRQATRRYALLYLDIDRFKVINDSLGHLAGDEVLKATSRRLQACVREPDIVARLAGDEFAILLEDVEVPGTAIKVAQRVIAALAAPLQVAGKELEPSASIGVALADARYQTADEVLRDADQALYRAKALGRKRFELFDASHQKTAVDVLAMEGELRVALQREQFEPYFQPIVDLASGATVGYEALLRWNHPSRGVLAPGAFMRIAEDNGSIEEIDWQMFEASCRIGRRLLGPGMRVGINVSPMHLRRAGFGDRLLALVGHCGLDPGQLVVEITEGSLLDDPERVGGLLDRLREAGIDAALDDFGTGYSSLSYLHNIPLRTLKIDRAFVARLGQGDRGDSATIVSAVLAMARALGMHVVAEGIETPQQRDMLLAMGCELGQGYLLGRPAPVTDWPALGN